jgi:hypothetical protein
LSWPTFPLTFNVLHRGVLIAVCVSVAAHGLVFLAPLLSTTSPGSVKFSVELQAQKDPKNMARMMLMPVASSITSTAPAAPEKLKSKPPASLEPLPTTDLEIIKKQESRFSRFAEYFRSQDLDVPAEPVNDWVLNVDSIPPNQSVTLVVAVYVSAQGDLDHFEVLNSSINVAETTKLVSKLETTLFVPARRAGLTVPSIREIEITITQTAKP